MPKGPVPAEFHDLLASTALGFLSTVDANGRPQVNPVWFIADAGTLRLSVKGDTVKYRNLRANPHVAMAIGDPSNPHRYVEVRGEVTALELYETLDWVNVLSRKYTGADFPPDTAGEPRYKVTVRIDAWTGQG